MTRATPKRGVVGYKLARAALGAVAVAALSSCRVVLGIDEPGAAGLVSADSGNATGVRHVVVGAVDSCAVFADGRAKCWGQGFGQAGVRGCFSDFQRGASLPFLDLGTNVRVKQIVSGLNHLCALTVDGRVKCWGGNSYGQLGLGDDRTRGCADLGDALAYVELGESASSLAAGDDHTCALLTGGGIKCWGSNAKGQLGIGSVDSAGKRPTDIGELPSVDLGVNRIKAIAASQNYTCAALSNAQVKCWGEGGAYLGQGDLRPRGTGAGDLKDSLPAIQVGFEVVDVAPACAFDSARNVKCWGIVWGLGGSVFQGDEPGEVGKLPFYAFAQPGRVVKLARNGASICALQESGTLYCLGPNAMGKNGSGSTSEWGMSKDELASALPPVDLGNATPVDISVGSTHTCAALSDGTVKCWGSNQYGELGIAGGNRGDDPGEMGNALPPVELF